jgi:glycogen phosphorylase
MKKKHTQKEIDEALVKREKFWELTEEYLCLDEKTLAETMAGHMEYTQGKEKFTSRCIDFYMSLAYSIRDYLIERSNDTHHQYYEKNVKRVYYLSLEYLMGRTLSNSLINLRGYDLVRTTLEDFGIDWEEILDFEPDAGLGNGGLGRLAACFLDSMATLSIPSIGYGIRYDYGIFNQKIVDGFQVELPDQWLKFGNPWEIMRRDYVFEINLYGRVEHYTDEKGNLRFAWVDTRKVLALPYDTPIPGFGNHTVNFLRLWSAKAATEFDLETFNQGDYMKAVYAKDLTETISRVLYPKDDMLVGKELRLIQEYFFVAATLFDIVRRHKVKNVSLDNLHEKAAMQLNDTHPSIAVAELMRILVDLEEMPWERAWEIVRNTIAYTNHTILPEALEKWPVELMERVLPRHLQIIYEINRRHLEEVAKRFPGDGDRLSRMSIIEEAPVKSVRMAYLAVVGSHSVNGVARLHSYLLKTTLLRDFAEMWPERFNNKTNGITPRRWLMLCNPELSKLVTKNIGEGWIKDLDEMKKLRSRADDDSFQKSWREIKQNNKAKLADYIKKTQNIDINLDSIFDCQVKRMHEYKRQLLNVLHVITLYNEIKNNPRGSFVPRTVIFAGKAAPGYAMAKLVIKLINAVADKVNNDPAIGNLLKVVFMENYSVTLAELIIPAADLSEQISTAGMEASGTGNMKFALNGALTIGTLDGANIEIMEEVGKDNIFIFGLTSDEVQQLRAEGYDPFDEVHGDPRLRECLEMIARGHFSNGENGLFKPLIDSLLTKGDYFLVLKDYRAYVDAQEKVSNAFKDRKKWTKASIMNSCQVGKFSSDRTIREYAHEIWDAAPVVIERKRMQVKPLVHMKK